MGRKKKERPVENVSPYQKIPDACKTLGLSQYSIRKGCKAGTIPHVMNGNRYMIDIPAYRELLRKESMSKLVAD